MTASPATKKFKKQPSPANDVRPADVPNDVDPVLLRLTALAEQEQLTNTALAKRIGVSRPTLVGWLAHLRAQVAGEEPSGIARRFRYHAQDEALRGRIASALSQPEAYLLTLSLEDSSDQQASTDSRAASAVMLAIGRGTPLGWVSEISDRETLRHGMAQLVESIDNVRATTVIAESRGHVFRHEHQHQIVIHAVTPHESFGTSNDDWKAKAKDDINTVLTANNYPGSWEHGAKTPRVSISTNGSDLEPCRERGGEWFAGDELHQIGSLVCPYTTAPRAPGVGLLAREVGGGHQWRTGLVIGGSYSGSVPTASHIAESLGAGHIRIDDVVRLTAGAHRERGIAVRQALSTDEQEMHAGYIAHETLAGMKSSTIPGAWLLSMEVEPAQQYQPLQAALTTAPDVLVTIHLGEQLYPFAAWRLAAAAINQERTITDRTVAPNDDLARAEERGIYTSDQLTHVSDGTQIGDTLEDLRIRKAVLERQAHRAAEFETKLEEWDQTLTDIEKSRAGNKELITLRLLLGDLPGDAQGFCFDGDRYQAVRDVIRSGRNVLYEDTVDGLVDAWVNLAGEVLAYLCDISGDNRETYGSRLHPGPGTLAFRQIAPL